MSVVAQAFNQSTLRSRRGQSSVRKGQLGLQSESQSYESYETLSW